MHARIHHSKSYASRRAIVNVVIDYYKCLGGKAPRGSLSVAPCSTQTLGQSYNTNLSSSKFEVISKERLQLHVYQGFKVMA